MTLTKDKTVEQMKSLYTYINNYSSSKQSEKILDIIEKLENKKMMIGFAGHFSAGKSTLINTLLNKEMLPSSPIPTSANIVQLNSGESETVVYFKEEPPVRYEGDIEFDRLQSLCKEGEEITRVDISHPESGLPSHVVVLDTPGVDSTNDADRLITESSLHVMDHMYYVMDYNHVQSEVNLQFLWEMQKRGTPFSIVINQIDKHNEDEISFYNFTRSVKDSFDQWDISPDRIYYTSMRDFDISISTFEDLKEDFRGLFERSYEVIEKQAKLDAESVIQECLKEAEEDFYQEKQELLERKKELETLLEDSHLSVEDQVTTEELIQKLHDDVKEKVRQFIPNAYLMPSVLRDDAKEFLEAQQPGFKVGFLFSKKKTDEEREARNLKFYQHLDEVIEKNLKWPLRDRWLEVAEKHKVTDERLLKNIQDFPFKYNKDRLHDLVEKGAEVTGDYVLRYTDQVSNDVKKEVRRFTQNIQEQLEQILKEYQENDYDKHQKAYDALEENSQIDKKLEQFNRRIKSFQEDLYKRFRTPASDKDIKVVEDELKKRKDRVLTGSELPLEKKALINPDYGAPERTASSKSDQSIAIDSILTKVDETLSIVGNVQGLDSLIDQLKGKKERLKNRHYTVALFGAFSAGKSSFANALLGERVLPVSPNPTTATINKISPPTEECPDRTIHVAVKTESQMLHDLSGILQTLGVEASTLKEVHETLLALPKVDRDTLDHKQLSFLEAFLDGFEEMHIYMNQSISIQWNQFSKYVSEEKTSCFIESMELFYDCPLTSAGVTLVDTPGADSANARHTDVSFEYIKDADAVLFVTYYNHPFSKADQSFLTQLGRVKDSFAMDKMFFVINAKDLASSEDELRSVEDYLIDQLAAFQIRNPRLYSLSSLHGLKEKQGKNTEPSNLDTFEQGFQRFLDEELAQVLVGSIIQDIEEIIETLSEFIKNAKLDHKERKEQLALLEKQEADSLTTIRQKDTRRGRETVENKVEKQVYYAHERMMLQFNDLFKQHFNPATINGKDQDVKTQLQEAAESLVNEVNFEMKQELRAISLRVERLIEDLINQTKEDIQRQLKKTRSSLRLNTNEWEPLSLPAIEVTVNLEEKPLNGILKQFKSTKTFFEKNEKEAMKEDLSKMISPLLKEEFEQSIPILNDHYVRCYKEKVDHYKEEWEKHIIDTFKRLTFNLHNPGDTTEIEKALRQMKQLSF